MFTCHFNVNVEIQKNIQKLAISGDWMEFDAEAKDVLLETARQGLRLFKPRTHET
jgi:hypothetical protein